ncbi:MAG TPA: hypothetical protein DDZ89_02290, partial [Clostridiales bacterium]|nr:hypothetical protein [Clostridiales bacterium]
MDKKILVIIDGKTNDLLEVMKRNHVSYDVVHPDMVHKLDMNDYHGIMILGGNNEEPLHIHPKDRLVIDEQIKMGKRVFGEYFKSIHNVSFIDCISTRFERPVAFMDFPKAGLEKGDILDEQSNNRQKVYLHTSKGWPLLQYVGNPTGFYKTEIDFAKSRAKAAYALWFELDNFLACSFRMVNFIKAKFSPR